MTQDAAVRVPGHDLGQFHPCKPCHLQIWDNSSGVCAGTQCVPLLRDSDRPRALYITAVASLRPRLTSQQQRICEPRQVRPCLAAPDARQCMYELLCGSGLCAKGCWSYFRVQVVTSSLLEVSELPDSGSPQITRAGSHA